MFKVNNKDIILLKQNDEETYLKVRSHYINPICFFICNEYNLSKVEAQDLAEEIFQKAAYSKIHQYDIKKGSFSTWLFTIAKHSCIDYIKENVNVSYLSSNINIEQIPFFQENNNIFYTIKKYLDVDEYNYLINHLIYEKKIEEIALEFNISKRTVIRKIKHAKKIIFLHKDEFI